MGERPVVRARPRHRLTRLVLTCAAIAAVVAVAVVGWARWSVADGGADWTAHVPGVVRVADHDARRVLLATDDGFTVLDRRDGTVRADRQLDVTAADYAFVDGGVLVSGADALGVVTDGGEWAWREETPDRSIVAVGPARDVVVLRDAATEMLLGRDARTGEDRWAHPAVGIARPSTEPRSLVAARLRGTVGRTLVRVADGTAVGATSPTATVRTGRDAAVVHDGCDLQIVRQGGEVVPVDGPGEASACTVTAPAGEYAYVEVDRSQLFALDLASASMRALPLAADAATRPYLHDAGRWLPAASPTGLVVGDAATGQLASSPVATGPWPPERTLPAVGPDAVLAPARPEWWARTVGGADGPALMLRRPDGREVATYQTDGADVREAQVLGRREAVLVRDDGEVAMVR
ncbi:hypothetical protein [Georgenia deserti]|uniref:PQQ-binding-like beta-propeller repeat protein n=1 Tax=Georgenia deserti TaxID=2093781 RepID=A0ABW4L4N5_9MICO